MADLRCQLQEAVDANREVFGNKAQDQRLKQQVAAAEQASPAVAKAQQSAASTQQGSSVSKAQPGRELAGKVESIAISREQAIKAAGNQFGIARLRDRKEELSFRRDDTGLLEPIYVLRSGTADTSPDSFSSTKPTTTFLVFRGSSFVTVLQPFSTLPFNPEYVDITEGALENSEAAIQAFGGFLRAPVDMSFARDLFVSFQLGDWLVVDQKLYVTYCRAVRKRGLRGGFEWRKPEWFGAFYDVAAASLLPSDGNTNINTLFFYAYYDVVTYAIDLINGGIEASAAPFLRYRRKSESAAVREYLFGSLVLGPGLSYNYAMVEHSYSTSGSQRRMSEALLETIPESHPASSCAESFWQSEVDLQLPAFSTPSGVTPVFDPIRVPLSSGQQPYFYEDLFRPTNAPSFYADGVQAFPETITSANTIEGLKVVTDSSGVAELGSIDPALQNCSGLRKAFGLYSRSFADYAPAQVQDFESTFFTDNLNTTALELLSSPVDPPDGSAVNPQTVDGTPSDPDGQSVYFMATPEDQVKINAVFDAFSSDPEFVGYLIAPEDS